jgi:hypothetical protein
VKEAASFKSVRHPRHNKKSLSMQPPRLFCSSSQPVALESSITGATATNPAVEVQKAEHQLQQPIFR